MLTNIITPSVQVNRTTFQLPFPSGFFKKGVFRVDCPLLYMWRKIYIQRALQVAGELLDNEYPRNWLTVGRKLWLLGKGLTNNLLKYILVSVVYFLMIALFTDINKVADEVVLDSEVSIPFSSGAT